MFVRTLTKTGKCFLYCLAGLLILVALLAGFARLAVFYGEDYSERLAAVVSRYIGSPVQISGIELVWNRFDASASLSDVRILSKDSTETLLVLPSIELELNLRDMLLQRNLSVRKIQLKNLSLVAAYEGSGELKIHGYEISRKSKDRRNGSVDKDKSASIVNDGGGLKPNDETAELANDDAGIGRRGHSALSWLFNAGRIAILDSDITLTDSTRGKMHRIDNVDIRAFNSGDLHQIRLSSALPDAKGEVSIASFDFTGQADNVNDWTGQFYIDAKRLNLTEISDIWRDPLHRYSGLSDVQLWGRWRGTRVNQLRAVINSKDISIDLPLTNSEQLASFTANTLDIDLDWKRTSDGWESTFNKLTVDYGGDSTIPLRLDGVDLYTHRDSAGQREVRLAGPDISVDEVRPLLNFAQKLAPSIAVVNQLTAGTLRNWLVAVGRQESKWSLNVAKGDIDKLAVEPQSDIASKAGALGINELSASVYFREGVGRVELKPQSVNVLLPELYATPLPALNTEGIIHFASNNDQWEIATEDLKLGSVDVSTSTSFRLKLHQNGQRLIDLNTSVDHINLVKASDYYPTKIIKPKLLEWLNDAIVSGSIVRGQVTLAGDLADFSPENNKGVFYGEADVIDTTLKFKSDWPAATGMDGNLIFDSKSLRGRVYQGALRKAQFSDARLFIADFEKPVLELQTNAIGPLDDILDFAQTGPLAEDIGEFFGDATGSGASRLAFDVKVPLNKEVEDSLEVDGSVLLENAQIKAEEFGLNLESVTGKVNFNRKGVSFDSLFVRYLGLPLRVDAVQKTKGGKQINTITVDGPVAVSSVLQSYDVPLTESFEGISDWNVKLEIENAGPGSKAKIELTATSDLSGTAVNLPVPLAKPSDTLMVASVYRNFSEKDSDWWVRIPGLVQSRIRVGKDNKLESMAVALGNSNNTVLPWRGLAVHGDVTRLDALGWFDFGLEVEEASSDTNSEPFPLFAKVSARSFLAGTEELGAGVYIAYRDGANQIHRIENRYANGEFSLRLGAEPDEPLIVRLNHLDKILLEKLAATDSSDSNVTVRSFDPRDIRPLDVIVKELKWDDWRFSRVALRTQPEERGLAIVGLTAKQRSMRVSGSGRWEIYNAGGLPSHATTLDLNVTFDDIGQSIRAVGGGDSFAGGQGEVALSLGWPAAAYAPDLRAMTGEMFIAMRNGRILGVEPGAGRILGLFALQFLPRRLTLDFRDIVSTGLEYTTVSGNFAIANGKASTQTLLLTGPVAEILVHGHTDFVNDTYDQIVDVLPRVSGALPLIGVLSGGPAAGVTALVADGILKGLGVNLDEIGRRRYTLKGPWDSPSLDAVDLPSSRSRR